ncbi:NECA3 protein, partial [Pterocles burchelli]|nr:NECA3 protein [Pterocles burchelli]
MACAELLAVCLLSAERGPKPRRQPLPIFHDVNDGKLSFEEFKNYFADGILSSEELWELFSGIDRRHSEGVCPRGVCPRGVCLWGCASAFPAVPLLPASLSIPPWVLHLYETSSKMEQFLTRFLLRETMHQLQSLQASLECAVDTVEEQAGRERKDIKKSETSVGLRSGRRCGRRGQKNVCLSPTDPYSGMLTTGIRSPAIPWFNSCRAPLLPGCRAVKGLGLGSPGAVCQPCGCPQSARWKPGAEAHMQTCTLAPGPGGTGGTGGHTVPARWAPSQGHSCPHSVSACKLTDEACFILYEFWQDVTAWRSHLQSSCSRTFQRSIISLLESPELLTTMLFPASWWIMNNN